MCIPVLVLGVSSLVTKKDLSYALGKVKIRPR
jgi:hypothetical protein